MPNFDTTYCTLREGWLCWRHVNVVSKLTCICRLVSDESFIPTNTLNLTLPKLVPRVFHCYCSTNHRSFIALLVQQRAVHPSRLTLNASKNTNYRPDTKFDHSVPLPWQTTNLFYKHHQPSSDCRYTGNC